MQTFEYKVVPAPAKGEKARGLRSTGERFANAMSHLMNDLAAEGWEYLRADTLPCEERTGLRGRATTFQNVLVFRRAKEPVVKPETSSTVKRLSGFLGARKAIRETPLDLARPAPPLVADIAPQPRPEPDRTDRPGSQGVAAE